MTAKRAISGAFAGAVLMAATACSASFHIGGSMDEADVESQLSQALEDQTGTKPDEVDCPGDLKGKTDTTMKCVIKDGSDDIPVTLTVTEVDGTDLRFRYEVAEATKDASASGATVDEIQLEERISTMLEEEVGQKPDEIDCPGDLAGAVGETMTCTLTAGTDELGVAVEVTAVEGSTVDFHIEVEGA
ncbi:DUF4333 domain-containing protein [Nocardioides sp.]|uniref:DUF4333 domain-containing protein n=1 Tax=Nocardioides sp. TaxID=35761 RepID=UPI0019943FF7|nr:DUF4333 domain-containing protein [Nocardioides sp.]MBC7275630.1 DUF4333 domain-containing protein [Nocardioides sp.]